jgi:hypothetical protein
VIEFLELLLRSHAWIALLYPIGIHPPPSGFGLWGGGYGPTGLSNSPKGNPSPSSPLLRSINRTYSVIVASTGIPQPCPPSAVEPGAQVSVRAHNGTTAGNTDPVFTALYREALFAGGGDAITPDTEINYPVDNIGQIWVTGTAGDGIKVSIRAAAA